MPRKTMIEAVREAMDVMMGRDDDVVVFGEDVGFFGGVFRATQGLRAKYGKSRCFDAPISELGIVGAAVGMAAYGLRPCVEIQFADYMYPAYDQIVSEAARLKLGSQKVAAVGRREIEGLHAAIERAGRNTPAMEATGAGRRDPRSGFHGCENCLMADDG